MTAKQRHTAEARVAELAAEIAELERQLASRAFGGGALAERRAKLKRAEERRAVWLEKLAGT